MKKISISHYLLQIVLLVLLLSSFSSQQVQAQCSGVSESDSLELVALYHATNGANWNNNSGWLVEPVEEWFGITIKGCYVTEIVLEEKDMEGELIDLQLPNLTLLVLSHNSKLSGSIPDFSNLPNLEELYLHYNNLSGPIPDFSNLPKLKRLHLRTNNLSGSIPDFSNLASLVEISLVDNDLSGSIPDFNNLPNLKRLELQGNDLEGSIPDFSNLPNLEELYLNQCRLSGIIPDFSNLPNLKGLWLFENELSGKIPNFSNLPKLERFRVCPNNLQGPIPNFMSCPLLDVEDIDFSCVELALASEYSFYDENTNCIVNYANGHITIEINEVQAGERFSLELFNILGQQIDFIPNLSVPLHQEALPQVQGGVYIYNIQSSKGRVARGKVLVR